jgi:hypothetical protein
VTEAMSLIGTMIISSVCTAATLSKTGVALRARCCWLRVFGVSVRCGMRKPNTRASIKPSPDHHVQTEALGACDGSSARSLAGARTAQPRRGSRI